MYVKIIYTQISCTYIHIYFFLNFILMAEPFLACVFTHLSLNSWPLSCSLYFETNFKKEKKKIQGKYLSSWRTRKVYNLLGFSSLSVLSTASGCWFAIESEERGVSCLYPQEGAEEEKGCLSSGTAAESLKTYSLDCKSFSWAFLLLLPVSLGSFI